MQYQLYQDNEPSERLILYFNGWAMTPEAVEHLERPKGWDLLVVWDYRSLDLACDLSSYKQINLLAWSMGVWAADHFCSEHGHSLPIEQAIAVCGTGYPMDDRWGIPQMIFEGTLNGLNEANRTRFNRRMCGGRTYKHLFEALAKRSTEEIRGELAFVHEEAIGTTQTSPKHPTAPWTLAYIGMEDKIIPPANQQAYWLGQGVDYRLVADDAHYLFGRYTSWEELWR